MELVDLIKQADIVKYISQFIDLEQRGKEYWGLSFFRDERTPSLCVKTDPPFWYDFGNGYGGNIYSFIKQYHRCSTQEAVEKIKNFVGYDGEVSPPEEKLAATLDCKRYMAPKEPQRQSSSVVLPENYMERYEKKVEKLKIWANEGISMQSMEKFQVRYDAFSNRLVFPIRNEAGKIINVCGRTIDPDFKAKQIRKYTYFYPFGSLNVIFGLFENIGAIKAAKEIILFEGCKSVLIADTWGLHNTGAVLTSHLSTGQMKLLARLAVHVVFALDKEIDVEKDKNIGRLKNYTNVEYIKDTKNLLSEKDSPVDRGKDVFFQLYKDRFRYR